MTTHDLEPWEPIAEQVKGLIRGQSQDVALAMANQARLRMNPIDPTQVIHLLSIGFAEGWAACSTARDQEQRP